MTAPTDAKKPWETPTITVLGTVESLTTAGTAGGEDDGGFTSF